MDASCPITWIEPDLTVNADPAAQLRLLDLQAADTALAQLAHRRSTLPELAALADATQRTDVLTTEAAELETRLADVDSDQRRLEAEVDNVRARTARDERRLTGGGLPAKELESLQHEIATLARRQTSLEDDVLDMMEQRESLDSKLRSVATRRADLDAEREKLEDARDAARAVQSAGGRFRRHRSGASPLARAPPRSRSNEWAAAGGARTRPSRPPPRRLPSARSGRPVAASPRLCPSTRHRGGSRSRSSRRSASAWRAA